MDPVEVVKRFYDGLNAHDANAVVACLKPGGTWNCPAVGVASISGDQIASLVQSMIAALPGLKFKVGLIERMDAEFFFDPGPDVFIGTIWMMSSGHGEDQILLVGADTFRIEGELISCLDGIWDSARVPSQLKSEIIQRLPQK